MMRHLWLLLLVVGGCDTGAPGPLSWDGRFEGIGPGESSYFNQVHVGVVDGAAGYDDLEAQALALIAGAELGVDVALARFESTAIATALVAAAEAGIEVRVVGDVDHRQQAGFLAVEEGGVLPVYGDGPLAWQAIFGADPVLRGGDDSRMTHNFILVDRRRLLNLSVGFPGGEAGHGQAYFATVSEDLGKDYGDVFDQLHGEVFATTLTFYDQSVSSDNNRRTYYPTEDGLLEVYFGPQEPLMKEVIDQIYSARQSVHLASPVLLNTEVARALRYKAIAGFEVRVVVGQANGADDDAGALAGQLAALPGGADGGMYRLHPPVAQTLVIIDGAEASGFDPAGRGIVLSLPIFASVPFRIVEVTQDGLRLEARPSDRFSDANMWVVHENRAAVDDFTALTGTFETLFGAGEAL